MVIPAQYLRASCEKLRGVWKQGLPAVICAKGIEESSGELMSEMLAEELPQAKVAVLSGPTFAEEAALNKPTALTLACADERLGKDLVETLGTKTFRPYYSPDVVSVQIGGAVKNVMAIAAGVVAGKQMGDNARAALITRGLAEISRLAVALVIPAQYLRASCEKLRGVWKQGLPAVICAKGIEESSGELMSEMLAEELPQAKVAVLSGPTFAEEAALNKPTALTLACADERLGKDLVETLGTKTFRPYYSPDVVSVQIGGAVKNVMAIAAGVVAGKQMGDNAR